MTVLKVAGKAVAVAGIGTDVILAAGHFNRGETGKGIADATMAAGGTIALFVPHVGVGVLGVGGLKAWLETGIEHDTIVGHYQTCFRSFDGFDAMDIRARQLQPSAFEIFKIIKRFDPKPSDDGGVSP